MTDLSDTGSGFWQSRTRTQADLRLHDDVLRTFKSGEPIEVDVPPTPHFVEAQFMSVDENASGCVLHGQQTVLSFKEV